MKVIGYSFRSRPDKEYPYHELSKYLKQFEGCFQANFKCSEIYPEGRHCYPCTSIVELGPLIAGKFSGDAGMSGSPFLCKCKGTEEWKVLGVYIAGA